MVKKILSVFAIASIMLATSCSNEEFDNIQNGKESTVTFTAQLPEGLQAKTRAYGDGTTATQLQYMAYLLDDNGTWKPTSVTGEATMQQLKTTLSLQLVNGNTYKIVFWAAAPNSIYTFDTANAKVTANYASQANNQESMDAFYKVEEITVDGAASKTIELKRPFAQLNIGTADLDKAKDAGREVTKAAIKVNTYTSLDFKTEKAGGAQDVTFELAALPTGETFPVNGYDYLTMNYLLMGDKETKDVTISYDNAENRTFNNVPLQRNYRTNIFGNLLTSTEDITVVINPGFETPDLSTSVWDGKTTVKPVADKDGVHHITSAAEFMGMMNDSRPYPEGNKYKNVVLECDIDLGGNEIYGFGDGSGFFYGIFDGQGHTISNFVINHTAFNGVGTGLFNYCANYGEGATIKNLNVSKANVTGPKSVGVIAGAAYDGFTIENCRVSESVVNATEKRAGGLVGQITGATVRNCFVENTKIYTKSSGLNTENKDCQVIGHTNTGGVDENNSWKNVDIFRNYNF